VKTRQFFKSGTVGEATSPSRFPVWGLLFAGLLCYVSAISAYDGYLIVRTGDMIGDFERNPVGLLLIKCNGGDPALFLLAKTVGTIFVLYALRALNRHSQRLARPVALAVAMFQSGLLIFLENC
jgi:hypothetical protein